MEQEPVNITKADTLQSVPGIKSLETPGPTKATSWSAQMYELLTGTLKTTGS